MEEVEVRLLGPVEVCAGRQPVDLGPVRQRTVLAALAVDAGRPVTVETLIERVWSDRPPQRVRQAVYAYVTRIRKALRDRAAAAAVVRRSGGYLLDVAARQVDLHRFGQLVDQARDRDCPDAHRLTLFRQAHGLWRGAVMSDLAGDWADRLRQTYEQQRIDALVDWTDAEIGTGDAGRVMAVLSEQYDRYPLNEPLVAAMMRALSTLGRSADALACYRRTYRRLVDELGIEPGTQLQEIHRAILCGNRTGVPAAGPAPPSAPAQLPPDVPGFAGRRRELDRLDAAAVAGDGAAAGPAIMVISAVSGIAGVGKTALAVHWAHRVAARFPDGQLYVNLHGFGPGPTAVDPSEALRGFLEALGVPRQRIPTRLVDKAALYRSRLANRRALVVLDNARDAEQVRPLLPGSPGCMALVTSRDTLTGLVAAEGAKPLVVAPMPPAEAEELVTGRLGADRVAADPDAVSSIIASCAGLPLALAIITARAATWPDLPLASFAGQLGGAGRRLDALGGGDRDTDVRRVFAWSYRSLDPAAARLFRLLGLHPGTHITRAAAASLARLPAGVADSLLGELARGNLVAPRAGDRYVLHDLLRAYAGEQARIGEPVAVRRGALRRLCSHYLHTAYRAAIGLNPHRDRIHLPSPVSGAAITDIADADRAMAWFSAESTAMKHLVAQAARVPGLEPYAWRLAWTLWDFFNRRGQWPDWVAAQTAALEAAIGNSDAIGQAISHRGLVLAHSRLGRYSEARRHARLALDLYRAAGDAVGQAHLHFSLSWLDEQEDRLPDSLTRARQALDLFRSAHHQVGQANVGNAIGWRYARLGEYDETLRHCRAALALLEDLGDRHGQAATWDSIGYAHHHLGQHEQAMDSYHRALALFQLIGDRYNEADVLSHLGDTYQEIDDQAAAGVARAQATAILSEIAE